MPQTSILPYSILLILAAMTWILWHRVLNNNSTDSYVNTWFILPALLVFVLILRLLNISKAEGNIDTSTWLTSLLAVGHYPDTLWTFLNYTDSRPLTVLPLYIAARLGVNMYYDSAQVVGIVLWLTTIVILYRTISLFLTTGYALLFSWFLCLFIGTTGFYDYIAYNSEHISVLMITLASYWCSKNIKNEGISSPTIVLAGLLLGSLLFAKFQNVPMGLVLAGCMLYSLIRRSELSKVAMLIASGILPTLVVNLYYASRGELETFWNNYFWNYFYYSYTNDFNSVFGSVIERFNPIRIGTFIFHRLSHSLYYITILLASLFGIIYSIRSRVTLSPFQKTNGIFSALLLGVSVYACTQSGNLFDHYLLYLLVPFTYFVAWLASIVPPPFCSYIAVISLAGALIQGSFNILTRRPLTEPSTHNSDHLILREIQANSLPDDCLVIWGWADRLYVRSNLPNGYRYPQSFHLVFKNSRLQEFRRTIFLKDMEQNKPALFVDAAIPGISTEHLLLPHDKLPLIKNYIKKHYKLIKTIKGVRFYKRLPS